MMRANIGQGTTLSMTCRSVWGDSGGDDTISGMSPQQGDFCPFHTTFRVIWSLVSHL